MHLKAVSARTQWARAGSIHHGPAPYLLHVHFNIMPKLLATAYVVGKKIAPYIELLRK
jgi:hypothetical protein